MRAVKVILNKCLKENKYFKVWNLNWKVDINEMPGLVGGKITYYKYKG